MDITSVAGLVVGMLAVFGGAVLEGLPISAIIGPTAFLIVAGGTVGALLTHAPGSDLKRAFGQGIKVAFGPVNMDYRPLIEEIIKVATVARKEGVLAIEGMRASIQDPMFQHALKYVIDGFEPKTVGEILENDAYIEMEELEAAGKTLEAAGGYSPTIGIIGAVLGLIHVMRNLDKPDEIGPGIAIAFVATIYGVALANLIFMPMGAKVKRKAVLLSMKANVVRTGIQGIQEGLNPHFLKEKLEVFLEHSLRSKGDH